MKKTILGFQTIAKELTFDFQEKQLLSNGFVLEIKDRNISRYKSDTQYAFIMYMGNNKGYETIFYDIEK